MSCCVSSFCCPAMASPEQKAGVSGHQRRAHFMSIILLLPGVQWLLPPHPIEQMAAGLLEWFWLLGYLLYLVTQEGSWDRPLLLKAAASSACMHFCAQSTLTWSGSLQGRSSPVGLAWSPATVYFPPFGRRWIL